ncbi:polysaccharide deacetylase family protein [candidate division KSB1 bacterium]|nr:polysaccharide deacetylase family protein [candidate division KSB1 bacterium]
MMNRRLHSLKWSYRKNAYDIAGVLGRQFPDFILSNNPKPIKNQVPVFVLHGVKPEPFTQQLEYLKTNGYRTLNADELYAVLTNQHQCPENAIALTFDDGWSNMYSVAFPLLKKYGFQAICFLVPGLIQESAPKQITLEDVWAGKAALADVQSRDFADSPLSTWEEIAEMHASGIVDFQAHTMYHHLVATSPKLIDFIHPAFPYYRFGPINVPVYLQNGNELVSRQLPLGTPIYDAEPRLYGKYRFYDPELLRQACVEFVNQNGGNEFFRKSDWRTELTTFFSRTKQELNDKGRYETQADLEQDILRDLEQTKQILEKCLPGKKVQHLCYPWFLGSETAVKMSREAGYIANYWGTLFNNPVPRPGTDPFYISRTEDIYIYRLPGDGRKSLSSLMKQKIRHFLPGFLKTIK